MADLLNEVTSKEFGRKSFLKGTGALVVTMGVAGAGTAAATSADVSPYASPGPFQQDSLDSWLVIHADNTASVKLGKVELGQGTSTGLLMIAAEELSMTLSQMRAISNDTAVTPNQGATVGSQGMKTGGKQTRAAAAAGAAALRTLAAASLGADASTLTVKAGVVTAPNGKSVTYGALIGDKLFNVTVDKAYNLTPTTAVPPAPGAGLAPAFPGLTKPVSKYTIVGTSPKRLDLPSKVNGSYTYVHNVKVPGMLHGRVVRPKGQAAYGWTYDIVSVDASSIAHIPGAQVIRKANFLGVVAPKEYDAIQAASSLKVTFAEPPTISSAGNLWKQMRAHDTAGLAPAKYNVNTGNFDTAFASAAFKVSQTYAMPYHGHHPIGPTCAVADVTANGARIFTNHQNIYSVRTGLQTVLGMPMSQIRVTYVEGGSVFGTNPQGDTVYAAAIMSQIAGKPVRMQMMRWDEHGWDNYGPAELMDIRGAADAAGNITGTEYTQFGIPGFSTIPASHMSGAETIVISTTANGDSNNSGTQYAIPNRRVVTKTLPLAKNYFKTAALRAPQALHSAWGYEQMIDELAYAAKMDPAAFRLKNIATHERELALGLTTLTYNRWKAALVDVMAQSKWQAKVANSVAQTGNVRKGRGIALGAFAGTQAAAVVDIELNVKTGKIVAKELWVSQDNGISFYIDGGVNNSIGAAIQGVSRALVEGLNFDTKYVTGLDWVTYPMLRFKDHPKVNMFVLQRYDIPEVQTATLGSNGASVQNGVVERDGIYAGGSGEPALAPVAAAIGNAFFDATGVRLREAPMTPARVRATLKLAGM